MRHVARASIALALPLLVGLAAAAPSTESKVESNPEKAIKQYGEAVKKSPDNADNWYNLGLAYIQLKRFEEAVAPALRAVELSPMNARAHFRAGEALAGTGRDAEALPRFIEAATLEPTLTAAHVRVGQAYLATGKNAEAVEALKAALKTKPEDPRPIYSTLGETYLEMGDVEQSIRWFEKTAEVAPNDPVSHFNLGAVYLRLVARDQAFRAKAGEAFGRSSDLDPKDPRTAYLAAENLAFADRAADARRFLVRVFEIDPQGKKLSPEMFKAAQELKQLLAP